MCTHWLDTRVSWFRGSGHFITPAVPPLSSFALTKNLELEVALQLPSFVGRDASVARCVPRLSLGDLQVPVPCLNKKKTNPSLERNFVDVAVNVTFLRHFLTHITVADCAP